MAKWTNLDEAEISRLSSKNRASHVKVEDRRNNGSQTPVKAGSELSGAIGREFDGVSVSKRLAKIKPKLVYPKKRTETEVLQGCMLILECHPQVAIWWRQQTGAAKFGDRFVRFSFRGASDLMFILKGGRFGACEAKATGKKPDDNQAAFLRNVADAGGLAIWTDNPAKLQSALDAIS